MKRIKLLATLTVLSTNVSAAFKWHYLIPAALRSVQHSQHISSVSRQADTCYNPVVEGYGGEAFWLVLIFIGLCFLAFLLYEPKADINERQWKSHVSKSYDRQPQYIELANNGGILIRT